MKTGSCGLLACSLLLVAVSGAEQSRLDIGPFSTAGLTHWQEKSFAGHTRYTLI